MATRGVKWQRVKGSGGGETKVGGRTNAREGERSTWRAYECRVRSEDASERAESECVFSILYENKLDNAEAMADSSVRAATPPWVQTRV